MSGKLIVIEGLDGSGKATQAKLLSEKLVSLGKKSFNISFPDYNEPSSSLIKMYLNSEFGNDPSDVNAYAASSFYAVDRYSSFMKFWKDSYKEGSIIISDRYTTSNAVYQMSKISKYEWDEYINWLEDYEYNKLGIPKPDSVIYLDMPTDVSQNLMNIRYHGDEEKKDLHESNKHFLNHCRDSALYCIDKLNWNVVNCSCNNKPKTIDEIHNDILNIVKTIINI